MPVELALAIMDPERILPRPAGEGMSSGLMARQSAVPDSATVVEKTKPGGVRSRRYHIAGLESASVSESCSVDCQGSLLCNLCQHPERTVSMMEDLLWQMQPRQKLLYF